MLDALMVFDGVCNLCSSTVRAVLAMDRVGAIRFTPAQSPYGRLLCQRAGVDPENPSTFLFFEHGKPLEASEAVVAMMARLPWPWRTARLIRLIPRALRDAAYRWIARRRYRLFGRRATCMRPVPSVRARFIDEIPPDFR